MLVISANTNYGTVLLILHDKLRHIFHDYRVHNITKSWDKKNLEAFSYQDYDYMTKVSSPVFHYRRDDDSVVVYRDDKALNHLANFMINNLTLLSIFDCIISLRINISRH